MHCAVWMLLAAMMSADTEGADGHGKLAPFQGVWDIAEAERDGKPDESAGAGTVTIEGNQFTTRIHDQVARAGTLSVDPNKNPPTIDATYTQGPYKGKTAHGIYQLNGDTWTMLYGLPDQERPTQMAESGGQGQVRLVLKKKQR